MRYTKEFKEEALKLSDAIGVRNTAEQLGLNYNTLMDWHKYRQNVNFQSEGHRWH